MTVKYTSWTNNLQKYIKSLSSSKYRKKYNRYMIEGDKICSLIIEKTPNDIEYLVATNEWLNENKTILAATEIVTITVDKDTLKSVSNFKTASDVIIIAKRHSHKVKDILKPSFRGVYLDDVQDPGNVGTIIRTAAWFGFDYVIRSSGSADFYNPKVLQSTMGGYLNVELWKSDLKSIRENFLNVYLIGTAIDGIDYRKFDEEIKQMLIVVGNEGKGMRKETIRLMDKVLSIPSDGDVESLNASVAFGIIASQFS